MSDRKEERIRRERDGEFEKLSRIGSYAFISRSPELSIA